MVFLVPTVITVLAGIAFALLFREKPAGEVAVSSN
jgi:hypothetical protein